MGAKAWFIAYFDVDPRTVLSDRPKLDRAASRMLAERFFPDTDIADMEDGPVDQWVFDPSDIPIARFAVKARRLSWKFW